MKCSVCTLAVAALSLGTAQAQSPWIVPPGAPTHGLSTVPNASPTIISPQAQVLWGIKRETVAGPGASSHNTIFATSDNGQNWQQAATVGSNTAIIDLSAVDGQNAWALYLNTQSNVMQLWRTSSGPAGLAPMGNTLPTSFSGLHFFTNTTGIAFARLQATDTAWPVYRTTDGGLTWSLVANLPTAASPGTTRFIESKHHLGNTLWLTASDNSLLRTTDAGVTWTTIPNVLSNPHTGSSVSRLSFGDALHGIAYISDMTSPIRAVKRTSDGGLTWTSIAAAPNNIIALTAIKGIPNAYMAYSSVMRASNATYISFDQAASWQLIDSDPNNVNSILITDLLSNAPGQVWGAVSSVFSPAMVRYNGTALAAKSAAVATSLRAYPNPTAGRLQLAGELPVGGATARVYDAAGRLCRQGHVSGTARELDLAGLPAGLYQVQLTSASGALRSLRVNKE